MFSGGKKKCRQLFRGHQSISSMRLPLSISGWMKFSRENSQSVREPSAERAFLSRTSERRRPPSLQARPPLACCSRSGWKLSSVWANLLSALPHSSNSSQSERILPARSSGSWEYSLSAAAASLSLCVFFPSSS